APRPTRKRGEQRRAEDRGEESPRRRRRYATRARVQLRSDRLVAGSLARIAKCQHPYFIWSQLCGDTAHTMVDVVVACTTGERLQLGFEVLGARSPPSAQP